MKEDIMRQAIGDIDDKLIEGSEKQQSIKRTRLSWVKWGSIAAAFVLVIAMGIMILPGMLKGNDPVVTPNTPSVGTIDYGTAQRVSTQFDPMPLDQYVQSYDVLAIARCDRVTPRSPWEGYTKYSFTTIQVLGGDFSEDHFESFVPRYALGEMETGTNEYEVGKTYLLLLMRVEEMFDVYYQPPYFGTVFCVSDNRFEAGIDILNPPELKTAEEAQAYLVSAFNAAEHRTFPEKTRYEDPFEEFFEESTAIGKMKVVRIEKGIGKDIAYCECIELYKGQSSDLCYLAGTNLAHIAVLPETVAAGKEYIIGFNGDKISTKESVKEYSPELVERIAMRKNH